MYSNIEQKCINAITESVIIDRYLEYDDKYIFLYLAVYC